MISKKKCGINEEEKELYSPKKGYDITGAFRESSINKRVV
jgi:hypothetical protein